MFERADREPSPETRRSLLTFVVAGGGFAGAELAGGFASKKDREESRDRWSERRFRGGRRVGR